MALLEVTALALPIYLTATAVLAAVIGAVGWTLHRLRHRLGAPVWLALPLAWTAGEWLRAHLPGSLAFPWLGLGTSLTGFPELVGIAELVGARGVTFWLALAAGLVAAVLVRWREKRRWGLLGVAVVLVLAVPAGWGVWRADALALRPAARIAVVQPEVSREDRRGPERGSQAIRSVLASPELRPGTGRLDLVVWPETIFPVRFEGPEGRPVRRFARQYALDVGAPILLGAFGSAPSDAGGRHNSAFLVDSSGPTGFAYHKRFLVPVVERAPLVPFRALPDAGVRERLRPGAGWPLGSLGGDVRFGVLICYEAAFPEAARAYRSGGADLLVNISNDAWYGLDARFARTTGLWQHPAHLVMRAIETRSGVARAANGGVSMFVDPVGRRYGAASLHEPAARVRTAYTTDVRTLYVRFGDVVGASAAAATLLLVLGAGWAGLDHSNKNDY